MLIRCWAAAFALLVPSFAVGADHPSKGYKPNDLQKGYSAAGEESIGDLTFTSSAERPPFESLTDAERYMIYGAKPGPGVPGDLVIAWYTKVYTFANKYHQAYGEIPDQLTEKELRRYWRSASPDYMELYRSPLTGEWPKLKEENPSPGNLYMRYLTPDEMRQLAPEGDWRHRIWFEGKASASPWDPDSGSTKNVALSGAPMYIRVYGHNGVIMDGVVFITEPR